MLQLGCLLGVFAGSAAYAQVFNLHCIDQGTAFPGGGYNALAYCQGPFSDPGNNVWNGFDIPGGRPQSSYGYGSGFPNDPLYLGVGTNLPGNNPGNPYAFVNRSSSYPGTSFFIAPNSTGATNASGVLPVFVPISGSTLERAACNAYSDSVESPITVRMLSGGDNFLNGYIATDVPTADGQRQTPGWVFQSCAFVNAASQGNPFIAGLPQGTCILSNVPAGSAPYSLYLFGANPDGTKGASFVVSNTGAPRAGLPMTINPNAATGSGPLNTWVLGQDYVVFDHVVPDANGRIAISWFPVSNSVSGLTGEGDFNGLQLVPSSLDSSVPATSPPCFVVQPFNSTFGGGNTATLTVDARGTPAPTIEWWQTNANGTLTDTTQSGGTLSIANFAAGNAGSYFAVATASSISTTSTVAVISLATTPVIASQSPTTGLTLVAGQTVNLTVSITGANPATYNWYSNSTLVATTTGTPNVAPVNLGTTVAYAGTGSTSSYIAGPMTANCTLSCTVANSYLPSGVSDTTIAVTVVPQLSGTYDTTVLSLNPVGYWPLNETSGTIATNYSTNGPVLNGVYSAVAACPLLQGVAGPTVLAAEANNFGTQFSTQGTQDNNDSRTGVVINDPALMNISSNVSVAMWVNQPVANGTYNIQEVYGQADGTLIRYSVFGTSDAQMDFVDGGNDITGGPLLNDGNWHLWTATFNATNLTVATYLDGVQINSGVESGVPGTSSQVTCIGSAPDDTGRNFVGSVCRVANFASVLTPAQVKALWDSAYGGIITEPPANEYYAAGSSVSLTANVQAPFVQWYKGGTPGVPGTGTLVVNGTEVSGTVITGANTGTLTFTPPSAGDYATYYVVVGNGSTLGSSTITAFSTPVTLAQLPVPTGAYDTAVLALNPIAYWPLNETSGTVAYNYSATYGGALNGTIQEYSEAPNVLGVPGPSITGLGGGDTAISFGLLNPGPGNDLVGANYCGTENALSAARSGTGITIGNTNLMVTSNLTIAMWALLPNGLNTSGNQGYAYGQQNNANGHMAFLGATGGGQIYWSDGGSAYQAGPHLGDGTWHLWVATYNATNTTTSNYIDGAYVVGSQKVQNNALTFSTLTTTIGSDSAGGYTRNWNGDICRMAVFTNVLTPDQVASLYNVSGVPPFFTAQPPAVVVADAGAATTIGNVTSEGSATVVNSWYFGAPGSGTLLSTGGRFTATETNLTISPVEGGDAGSYYVVAVNSVGMATSLVSVLTVGTTVTDEIYAGQSPTFSVASGAASYAWYTNNVLDTSATSSTYTFHGVTIPLNNGETVYALINGTEYGATNTLDVLAAPADPYPAAVLLDHPMAYFRLNEADNGLGNNGTVAHEFINGYNGVYQNDGTPADLVLGVAGFPYGSPLAANTDTAASFGTLYSGGVNGTPAGPSNNFVGFIPTIDFSTAPSNSPSYVPAEFSVEAWVYIGEGQHNGSIVTKGYGLGDGNTAAGFFEQFSLQASDVGSTGSRYDFCVHDALGNLVSAETGSFYPGYQDPPGTAFIPLVAYWQHVVGVCDQSNGVVRIFVNGVQAASGTLRKTNGIMSTLVPMSIGAKQQNNTSGIYDGQLNGSVDEVAIYNYALTTNQVLTHYFAAGIVPILILQPTNDPAIGSPGQTNPPQGSSVTLKGVGFGSPALHYQWYDAVAGTPVNSANEPGNIGGTTSNLTLVNVSGSGPNTIGSGRFELVVSNPYGSVTSAVVMLNPVPGPPIISPDLPATNYALVGSSAVFSIGASGTFPQTNAWYYNNGTTTVQLQNSGRYTITAGANPTLTIANVTVADQGTYQVLVTNATSYPFPSSSTPSVLVVEYEPTFNGNGTGWTAVTPAGSGASPTFPAVNQMQITTAGAGGQNNAFWFNTPMYIGAFEASFTYSDQNTTFAADGSTFTIQNSAAGITAVGGGGGDLAINGITPSVSLQFTLWGANQDGNSGYGWGTNGASVENVQTPEFFLNENPSTGAGGYSPDNQTKVMNVTYIGGYLSLFVSNTTTFNVGSTNFYVGDITQILGTNVALIGFTGACGGYNMTQIFGDFTFTPIPTLSAVLSGQNVVLTWPTAIGGYVLQSCATVNGTYTTVPGTPPVAGVNYQVTVPLPTGSGALFYRLFVP